MIFSLWMYQRLAEGSDYELDLTPYARNTWRRTTRAMGGYWTADFTISGISTYRLQQLYSTIIGKRVVEMSYGMVRWEGEDAGLSKSQFLWFPVAAFVVAGAASALPAMSGWPLNHGLGGIVGDTVFGMLAKMFALINAGRSG